jgi:hypothetical protein
MKHAPDIIPSCYSCVNWNYVGVHVGTCKSKEFQVITKEKKEYHITTRQDFFCAAYSPNSKLIDEVMQAVNGDNDDE